MELQDYVTRCYPEDTYRLVGFHYLLPYTQTWVFDSHYKGSWLEPKWLQSILPRCI